MDDPCRPCRAPSLSHSLEETLLELEAGSDAPAPAQLQATHSHPVRIHVRDQRDSPDVQREALNGRLEVQLAVPRASGVPLAEQSGAQWRALAPREQPAWSALPALVAPGFPDKPSAVLDL